MEIIPVRVSGPGKREKVRCRMPTPRSNPSGLETEARPKCPNCGSDVYYKYGKTHSGRSRFICLLCNTQFSIGSRCTMKPQERPLCPVCGKRMHVYRREGNVTRFRCMAYPKCQQPATG